MSAQPLWQVILLGILEGLTEFLPVSSTGHLILAGHWLEFASTPGRVFEVFIQLGAIMAICVLYVHKLWQTLIALPKERRAQQFALSVLVAFLPAALLGVLAHDTIKTILFHPVPVACALILGGVVMILVERFHLPTRFEQADTLPLKTAFLIGCFQTLALVPGVSRSGATIIGARYLGLDRKAAAEFSFFLAIPTMVGAVVYDISKNADALNAAAWDGMLAGFISAFLTALLVVRWLIAFVSRHSFAPFGYYRIALGLLVLFLMA